jgi:NhaP-type Na+/H+ or K+/H+ antiporter
MLVSTHTGRDERGWTLPRFLGAVGGLAFGVLLGWTAVQLTVRFWPWEIEVDLGTVFLVFVLVVSASTVAGAWLAGRHRQT